MTGTSSRGWRQQQEQQHLPDGQMQNILRRALSISSDVVEVGSAAAAEAEVRYTSPGKMLARRDTGESLGSPRRQSTLSDLMEDNTARRLSEAGVNRRPSASHILTEDTDSFIIGQRIYVDGVKSGRIQFIGETKFGPGEWAGVVLDEPFGRNDGSVSKIRYFQCDPNHGVFARLFRLTLGPIDGAGEVLEQMRKYGYEIADSPVGRRGSVGSSGGGSRRGSVSHDDHPSQQRMGSASPRAGTPENRRTSRTSPPLSEPRRISLGVPIDRRGSMGTSPMGRTPPGRSPLASPNTRTSYISGGEVRIDRDPDITKLTQDARRLSFGASSPRNSVSSGSPLRGAVQRRPSENNDSSDYSHHRESLGLTTSGRRGSDHNDHDHDERRLSEAGFRRHSNADSVLNEDTASLRVGQQVWVDGNKHGRIAFIGNVQFAKGEVAGVHLDRPHGKNNGSVGGVLYFQCEPKHGVFARLHRLTTEPLINEGEEENYY